MKRQPIRLLLVEDEGSYAELIQEVLADSPGSEFSVTHVACLDDALRQLETARFDLVLQDLTLPDAEGLSSYEQVYAASPGTPIIVLTGLDDQNIALQAVREGAQDYLVKGQVDAKMLVRIIHYAIERKAAAQALRESEEFFRLISENVTDLIAVLDTQGRRIYNSPSYRSLLGDPALLRGTNSFGEIHPEDRAKVERTFHRTVETGEGHRVEYRMLLKDGTIRYIESQGNAIKDHQGKTRKVVVISRDVTENRNAVIVMHRALEDLSKSHEELKSTQMQLIQSEKLEAVSTFVAGVAHEVKNPLQTIILGVDYLTNHLGQDETAAMVLADMAAAVHRADGNIRGLLEFSANKQRNIRDEDISHIVGQSLCAIENELKGGSITLIQELAAGLPMLKLDFRIMKHIFINLFMYSIRAMGNGGTLRVRTYLRQMKENLVVNGRTSHFLKIGDNVVVAEVEDTARAPAENRPAGSNEKDAGLGLIVLKKLVELCGGIVDVSFGSGNKYAFTFKPHRG